MSPNSNIEYVYIFSLIALFILLIAAANFINISTAQAFKRIKEVGVRKVLGAQRQQIVGQFLGESILITFCSAIMAVILIRLSLPLYNSFSGNNITIVQLYSFNFIFIFILITAFIGIISGLYPALFISALKLVNTIKSSITPKSSVTSVRKGLVIFQFPRKSNIYNKSQPF